ncbi:hypothetical protein BDZ97DRAFT_1771257 [Flammula alnicola]|nr:hypothetical protein BDZ97DRAFT_1771257 [Flammula alnicola]
MDPTPESQPETSTLHIPDGFAALLGPDGDRYIVPEFMIPATHQAFEAYRKQVKLDVANANGGASLDGTDTGTSTAAERHLPVPMSSRRVPMPVPMPFGHVGAGSNHPLPSGNSEGIPCILLGHKSVVFPADPPLTERELLTAHAEVKALQEQLGLSYKDASHRLYMAEWERLKADEEAKKFFTSLANRTKNSLENFQTRLSDIAHTNGHPVSEDTAGAEVLPDV